MFLLSNTLFQRSFGPSLASCVVTIGLLYLMTTLIVGQDLKLIPDPGQIVEFVHVHKEPELKLDREQAEKPIEPESLPPNPQINLTGGEPVYGLITKLVEIPGTEPDIGFGLSDGAYLPLVKVQPVYPRNAKARGIEGYTIVEFEVGPDGSVRNPRVIEYHPSRVFNASSLKAVLKFRYKPMVENGVPVVVTGVQNLFTFRLED